MVKRNHHQHTSNLSSTSFNGRHEEWTAYYPTLQLFFDGLHLWAAVYVFKKDCEEVSLGSKLIESRAIQVCIASSATPSTTVI
jgi:hypothetical protein